MLDLHRLNLAVDPKAGARANIRRAIRVAMHSRTTARVRAAKHPPSWHGSQTIITPTACPARIVLRHSLNRNALAASLIGQILDKLPVRPLTDLLVRNRALSHTIGHVPHITHHQAMHLLL